MDKVFKIIGFIVIFTIVALARTLGGHLGRQAAYHDIHEEFPAETTTLSSSQPSKMHEISTQKIVDKFVQGAKSVGLPKQLDDWTIFTNTYSEKIDNDTFNISHIYHLTMSSKTANSVIDQAFQDNLLDKILNQNCSRDEFKIFNQVDGITLYFRYFLDSHEIITITVPSKSCQNRSLANVQYNPLPQEDTEPEPVGLSDEEMQSMQNHEKNCKQIVKNQAYYFAYANYCDMETARDEQSFNNEFIQNGCDYLSSTEISELMQKTQNYFERSAEKASDYEGFCQKDYLFWKTLNRSTHLN